MKTDRPIRLAFTTIRRRSWAGGFNYQRNLFAALNRYRAGAITPVVFAGEGDDKSDLELLEQIPGVEVVRSGAFDRRVFQAISPICCGLDFAAISEFRRRKVDAIFEAARFFGWLCPYPTIAWIADLQHRELPDHFSRRARWRRDVGFRLQIVSGRTIMLSSKSAERDCLKYYPNSRGRTSVVKFASEPSPALLTSDPAEIVRKYDLPPRYFYLPNQFWRHKNHQAVMDALALLIRDGEEVVVAVSGGSDPKEPEYLDKMLRQAADRGLAEAFRYLGMIPISDVYALLRACAALINPSRFEGWSTTVEEAKSFGVPMILSDIEVHREQASEHALYFDPDAPQALVDQLRKFSASYWTVRNLNRETQNRVARFADDFVLSVRTAVAMSAHSSSR